MEHLNRVELSGSIENIKIRKISGINVANFIIATDFAYRKINGIQIIETTYNVTIRENKKIKNLE